MSSEILRRDHSDLDRIKLQKREWYYRNRKSVLKQQKVKWEEARISKRIESIEKKLNDFIEEYNAGTNKSAKYLDKTSYDCSESEVTIDDYYARSRGIFFGFLFSIVLIFLLIIVSTQSYFYFEFIRNLVWV